jgi:hypothetical protein
MCNIDIKTYNYELCKNHIKLTVVQCDKLTGPIPKNKPKKWVKWLPSQLALGFGLTVIGSEGVLFINCPRREIKLTRMGDQTCESDKGPCSNDGWLPLGFAEDAEGNVTWEEGPSLKASYEV